jgi:SpoIID/LytB domain protein
MRRALCAILAALSIGGGAASLEQLLAENFHVRVRLGNAREQQILVPTDLSFLVNRNGEITTRVNGGTELTVESVGLEPAPVRWRILLGTYAPYNKPAARALAARVARELNFPAELIERAGWGDEEGQLWVTLGLFETREEAFGYLQGVLPLVPRARLWRDDRDRRIAHLRVRDQRGHVVADLWEQVTLVPVDGTAQIGAQVRGESRHWRGQMICRADERGRILLINDVHVDDYLMSVVAQEIGDAPPASLRAQAIAARSEAFFKVNSVHHRDPLYDLCDTTHCQDYRGVEAETSESRRAVRATRGLVLMWEDEICDSVYSHNCGGVTTPMEDVWHSAGYPYIVGRLDTLESEEAPDLSSTGAIRAFLSDPPPVMGNPNRASGFPRYARRYFRWTWRVRVETLAEEVEEDFGVDLGRLRVATVTDRASSGRVRSLHLEGSGGTFDLNLSTDLCRLSGILSTLFVVDRIEGADGALESIRFLGGGWGHGVGMCQMGAYMRGLAGQSHREILGAYFPLVEIRRVY